jgi:RNA polymerase sigma-70 factor (ECF subfamily)
MSEATASLIERCLAGDQTAYSELYSLYADSVYRLCYSLLLHREDAEDVLQDTFVYAFKNLKRYDSGKSAFKTWLFTIALSRCRNMYRRKTPVQVGLTQLFQLDLAAPRSETPEAMLAHKATRDAIEGALADLSPVMRESIVLRYGHGLTYREIAEIMDCPQKTAESRVRLAHDKLRTLLSPVGQSLLEELVAL